MKTPHKDKEITPYKKVRFKRLKRLFLLYEIASQGQWILVMLKTLLGLGKRKSESSLISSYEDLIKSGIDEEKLGLICRKFTFLYRLLFLMAVMILGYAIYLMSLSSFMALLATAVAFCCMAQAFRYHFWCYQLRIKCLNCTFQQWFISLIRRKIGEK